MDEATSVEPSAPSRRRLEGDVGAGEDGGYILLLTALLMVPLLAFTALLVGLRLLGHSRLPALLAALGAIAVILLFTQQSAGGSVLIPNNLLGQIWLIAPILISAVVIAWPDVHGRRTVTPASGV